MSRPQSSLGHLIKIIAPLIILAVGGLATYLLANSLKKPARNVDNTRTTLVTTILPEIQKGLVFEVDGTVVPYREIALSAEVAGRVISKKKDAKGEMIEEGSYVEVGTPLLEIDREKYELVVELINAEVEQARLSVNEINDEIETTQQLVQLSNESYQLQEKQFKRFQQLYLSKTITESQLEREHQTLLTADNQKRTLEKQEKILTHKKESLLQAQLLAQTKLKQAQYDLDRTEIRSPISGVIIKDYIEENSYVQPGTKLYEIEDTTAVEVQANLKMDELAWIWRSRTKSTDPTINSAQDYRLPPAKVVVNYHSKGNSNAIYQWEGILSRFAGIGLDEKTRTAPILVRVPDPRAIKVNGVEQVTSGASPLVRGMYVQLEITADQEKSVLKIPSKALQPGDEVWTLEPSTEPDKQSTEKIQGTLKKHVVEVIRRQGDFVLIEETSADNKISATDRIIISPLPLRIEGLEVEEIIEQNKESKS